MHFKDSRVRDFKPQWLSPGFLSICIVSFLFLAAIAGSFSSREEQLAGNAHWAAFAAMPMAQADQMSTIGVWRHDRLSFQKDDEDVAHCGLIVRAVTPGTKTAAAEAALRGVWSGDAAVDAAVEETGLTDAFCGATPRLRNVLLPKIENAWAAPDNPRFLRHAAEEDTLLAGVFDLEARRIYTWLSVKPPAGAAPSS